MSTIIQHGMYGPPSKDELLQRTARKVGLFEARRLQRVEKILYAMAARKPKRSGK